MGFLKRDQIFAADDLKHEDVEVPEWGGTVRVRALTAGERDQWESSMAGETKNGQAIKVEDVRAKLIAFAAIDVETGERLFTLDDVTKLSKKSAAAMQRLWLVASRLSLVGAGDVDELGKN